MRPILTLSVTITTGCRPSCGNATRPRRAAPRAPRRQMPGRVAHLTSRGPRPGRRIRRAAMRSRLRKPTIGLAEDRPEVGRKTLPIRGAPDSRRRSACPGRDGLTRPGPAGRICRRFVPLRATKGRLRLLRCAAGMWRFQHERGRGETGRRDGLRSRCPQRTCGFKSLRPHSGYNSPLDFRRSA